MLRDKYRLTSANSMLSALNKFFELAGWDDCRVKTFKTGGHLSGVRRGISRSWSIAG
jgi:hypothetical protein